jgi:hypothetical protein
MAVTQVIIVRRGCADRFRSLQETFGAPPISARVIWDRRGKDRRHRARAASSDRRRAERRGPVPSSWSALDFLVTGPSGDQSAVTPLRVAAVVSAPVPGDLLVLRETSLNGPCSVSTVPGPAHTVLPSYAEAVAFAQRLADRGGVDVWFTEDHQAYTVVRRVRPPPVVPDPAEPEPRHR